MPVEHCEAAQMGTQLLEIQPRELKFVCKSIILSAIIWLCTNLEVEVEDGRFKGSVVGERSFLICNYGLSCASLLPNDKLTYANSHIPSFFSFQLS